MNLQRGIDRKEVKETIDNIKCGKLHRQTIIMPLLKGKSSKDECDNYRGISLLSVLGKSVWKSLDGEINGSSIRDDFGKEKVVWTRYLQLR